MLFTQKMIFLKNTKNIYKSIKSLLINGKLSIDAKMLLLMLKNLPDVQWVNQAAWKKKVYNEPEQTDDTPIY